jgi:RNA polymerase subunit RPABC4/transcription elongation factor Spt4
MIDTRNQTSVIPKPVWVLAIIAYFFFYLVLRFVAFPHDPHVQHWPHHMMGFASAVMPLFVSGWILLIGYVYGDAKRRGMRQWLWTLLAIFIPDLIGVILYFLLRDPLPFYCSHCGALVRSTFTFCPNCSTPLRPTCAQCGRGLEAIWKHCPHCGAAAPGPAVIPPPPQGAPPAAGSVQT